MSFEITQRDHEGFDILDLKGDLTLGHGDREFRDDLGRIIEAGKTRLILNLGAVCELDATGLGTLLFALTKLRNLGGRLAIFNLKPQHCEALMQARLETVVEVFKDEQDAINSFFPDRQVKHYDILQLVQSEQLNHPA